ncbi:peptidyl-prolyl cis-trans isomerase B (cyclophilin B) [Streptosporangium becharense]|uniref:Peptidyl-prolyl cis-trans isomerase B (Cyclophilin B) n=1 Tax=Streptosporangium becharense TaxID=1816182 RepID=A0A7W9MF57_9ACTN|nr:peptidylprolyl isomerase [Streptosporangium becharense]MBB2914990.1 peptidyl-prolyl cis-trans isomerase B (cyclophilin B) [Streptosporangium becharense]MBB5818039.1 peptidyl-prolyl cis-trans isomerase B (cyclophilin B) [Streptosporangium becharense]
MSGKERQKQLAREHYERQMQRRAERAAHDARVRRNALIGTSVAGVVVVGGVIAATVLFGGSDTKTGGADTGTTPQAAAAPRAFDPASGTCGYGADTDGSPAKNVGMPPAKVTGKPTTMTLATNRGDIVIKLSPDKAPCTVNSFAFLAEKDYFDGSKCHRMGSKRFPVLQCGDPLAKADGKNPTDGQGGPGYRFLSENLEGAKYTRGVVAMANSGAPDTNGSQFFIVYGDAPLSPDYTPFGTVTKGLEIIDKVNKAGVITPGPDDTGAPKETVEIKDVTMSSES